MVSFGEKAKIKKAVNLNKGRSYNVITTVLMIMIISRTSKSIFDKVTSP
jgi:hypothetical protein